MRVIYWHVNSLKVVHTQKALKSAEDINEKTKRFENGVVCLISLEEGDQDKENLFEMFYEDLMKYANQINVKKFFLYPYAHLSNNLLKPSLSKELFYSLVKFLKNKGLDVDYGEFGWYKEFKVHVKGHPLAELSRSF